MTRKRELAIVHNWRLCWRGESELLLASNITDESSGLRLIERQAGIQRGKALEQWSVGGQVRLDESLRGAPRECK